MGKQVINRIPGVLNSYIGSQHYVYTSIGTKSQWFEKIKNSIYDDYPAILDINTKGISAFGYTTTGHFVNVSGYNVSTDQVCITDPYGGRGNTWYAASDLYNANNNHFRKAIVW